MKITLEFNTDNPLGGKYKWNMGVNIPIDF